MKKDILSLSLEELGSELQLLGFGDQPYRAAQIFTWLHQKNCFQFEDMTNISKAFREQLKNNFSLHEPIAISQITAKKDNTEKYLFDIGNDTIIESVLMAYDYGLTACISTQAGCRMNCGFCASGLDGLDRNLLAGEMVAQVYGMQKGRPGKITRVVLMGIGEPLDNMENVLKFIQIINDKKGQNIGQRHITISTCGLIEQINALAELKLQITLAVSLHAPNDVVRNTLMPISKSNPYPLLMKACDNYTDKTNRRVTFEYALLSGVNDSDANALELAKNLKGKLCHVNLISVNEVKEKGVKPSVRLEKFADILDKNHIPVTIRRKLGEEIDAACGQLRHKYTCKEGF